MTASLLASVRLTMSSVCLARLVLTILKRFVLSEAFFNILFVDSCSFLYLEVHLSANFNAPTNANNPATINPNGFNFIAAVNPCHAFFTPLIVNIDAF